MYANHIRRMCVAGIKKNITRASVFVGKRTKTQTLCERTKIVQIVCVMGNTHKSEGEITRCCLTLCIVIGA